MKNPIHAARKSEDKLVLEGLHAIKHALRFGAKLDGLWSDQPGQVLALAEKLAPDIVPLLAARLERVSEAVFAGFSPRPPETRLIAVADRPRPSLHDIGVGPAVLLDRPRHPGNLGAVIRTAAAAEVAAVLSLDGVDPWSAAVLRGAAGLHFALPVLAVDEVPALGRPLIVLDDEGERLAPADLPAHAVYAFGSERDGPAPALRARAARTIAIPMRAGVSSLNLAAAVAVVLYTLRLRGEADTGQRSPRCT